MLTGLQMLQSVISPIRMFLQKNSIDEFKAKWIKQYLDSTVPFFSSPVFENMVFPELHRITINKRLFKEEKDNLRLTEIRQLKYPKPEQVLKNGRANFINQSMLYAAVNPLTAINEMKPDIGDLVTTTIWKQKENTFLVICPIFKKTSVDNICHNEMSLRFNISYEHELKQHSTNKAEQIDLLLQFMADCFAKDVDYDNNYDYFLSAYYANRIYKFYGSKIDALVYPSVADRLEFSNLAIKPEIFDSHFEPYEVIEGVVVEKPNYINNNGYQIKIMGKTKNFENELIIWK